MLLPWLLVCELEESFQNFPKGAKRDKGEPRGECYRTMASECRSYA